jgi:hypothetical protein
MIYIVWLTQFGREEMLIGLSESLDESRKLPSAVEELTEKIPKAMASALTKLLIPYRTAAREWVPETTGRNRLVRRTIFVSFTVAKATLTALISILKKLLDMLSRS